MINLSFNIRNPCSDRWDIVKSWSGATLFKNKFWECQINKTADIASFDFRYTVRQDHAGFFLCLGLIGYEIIFNFYDNRHWDSNTNDWQIYDR